MKGPARSGVGVDAVFKSVPKYEAVHVCGARKVLTETNNGKVELVVTDGGKIVARFPREQMDQAVAECERA